MKQAALTRLGLLVVDCPAGPNMYNESETLTKFELMDGAPVRGGWTSLVGCWSAPF